MSHPYDMDNTQVICRGVTCCQVYRHGFHLYPTHGFHPSFDFWLRQEPVLLRCARFGPGRGSP